MDKTPQGLEKHNSSIFASPLFALARHWVVPIGAAFLVLPTVDTEASTIAPGPTVPGYVHEIYDVEDGLPGTGISKALEDRHGFLWLATYEGLYRFDGLELEVFDSERVPSLASNRIVDLVETADGSLFIRSDRGHLTRRFEGAFSGCAESVPGVLGCDTDFGADAHGPWLEDSTERFWVGTESGLFRFPEGSSQAEKLLGGKVRWLFEDSSGRIWAGVGRQLRLRGTDGGFERIRTSPAWVESELKSLTQDGQGRFWGNTNRGVGVFDIDFADGPSAVARFDLLVPGRGRAVADSSGALWVGSEQGLLRAREPFDRLADPFDRLADPFPIAFGLRSKKIAISPDGKTWMAWSSRLLVDGRALEPPISDRWNLTSVMVDRRGTIWATSHGGELHAFRRALVTSKVLDPEWPGVHSVYEDIDGSLWSGGSRHSLFRDSEPMDGFPGAQPGQPIRTLMRDSLGVLWIGSARGLFTFDDEAYRGPWGPPELHRASIRALLEASDGALYVGTREGLFRKALVAGKPEWTHFSSEHGVHPVVRALLELPDGSLWLGTNGGGLIRFRDGRFTTIDRRRGLSSDLVRSIWSAGDGRLWIGTENRGLDRLDLDSVDSVEGPRIATIGRSQGLFSNGIHQIVDDGLGNLWMSSNRGIFRVRRSDLEAVADGHRSRLRSVAYGRREGMLDTEANGSGQHTGLRDRKGRIWFPTQRGLVGLDPRKLAREPKPPSARTTGVYTMEGEAIVESEEGAFELTPALRSFRVAYHAPALAEPEDLHYRYRLFPYQQQWQEVGPRREAAFSRVPPGRYRFEVQAGIEDVYDPSSSTLEIWVVPRFYETSVFSGAIGFLFLAAAIGAIRFRDSRARSRQQALEAMVRERTSTIEAQAESLRESNRFKSEFFANISHELRTPLTLMLGPLRDCSRGAFGPLGKQLASQIGLATRNAERQLALVDQLLDVAKLDAGRLELNRVPADLGSHSRRRVDAFLPLAERLRIELSLALPGFPVIVEYDPSEMEKVIDNLLSNALKFTPEGGRVAVTLEAPEEKGRAVLRVEDDGPGLSPEQRRHVFERFYRAEPSGNVPGTGLGLALARRLAEMHGGRLEIGSGELKGACFELTLPRGQVDEISSVADWWGTETDSSALATVEIPLDAQVRPAVWHTEGSSGATILVVDDHADIRAFIRRHLEPDFLVSEAADGLEALAMARSTTPDLVISDVMMPGLDGNDLVRTLRRDEKLMLVPVVMVTAKASQDSRLASLRRGVDDYLVKPFDPRELLARVHNLLSHRRRLLKLSQNGASSESRLRVSEIDATSADQAFLDRVRSVIEKELGNTELTVEKLASATACDRSHLLRKLRSLVRMSPSGLIRSMRLQRAAQLLRADVANVGEIAHAVGFKTAAHFSRAFSEHFGESPSAFAARHRESVLE